MRFALALVVAAAGCVAPGPEAPRWQTAGPVQPEAMLSISGTSRRNVWVVGADRGQGPLVLRFDGSQWSRLSTGHRGDLWWVQAFDDGQALMVGAGGALLRFDGTAFRRLSTGGLGRQVAFGVWGRSATDAWVVGGSAGRDGFVWRLEGDSVRTVPLPDDIPRRRDGELPSLLKVWGTDDGSVWLVGDRGVVLRSEAGGPLQVVPSPVTERLFTVHGRGEDVVLVGGVGSGVILDGKGLTQLAPEASPLLQGVFVGTTTAVAVGQAGAVLERVDGAWRLNDTGLRLDAESLHAVWVDEEGDVWSVGGNVLSARLDQGVLVVRSARNAPALPEPTPPSVPPVECPAALSDTSPTGSMARRWNEQALAAIRRDLPRPTVHARNLFHLSGAMYDVWAATQLQADGVLVREKRALNSLDRALAGAAYEVLERRYAKAIGGAVSSACFRAFATRVGADPSTPDGADADVTFGREVGRAWLAAYRDDGANEAADYADPSGYQSVNPALAIDEPSVELNDPSRFQLLNLSVAAAQNGLILPAGVQRYIGPHWGNVTPFALSRASDAGPWVDAGVPPAFEDPAMVDWVVEVIERTAELDPVDGSTMRLDPGALGNNPLGSNAGAGHLLNPATGQPYAPAVALRGDFGRVLAEYWADGPQSETPPGHWNVLFHRVAANPAFERRFDGVAVDALTFDVKGLLVLNAALHDAAIAAWDLKRRYDCARPLSLVRHMAARGQRSEPSATDYSPQGLPLKQGLIERITAASASPGERHAHLRPFVGELAVRGWRGEPGNRAADASGVAWIRAAEWLPYQRRTFVTPAFPGFVSGHSTFSRAAAEVMASVTGSRFFPGGLATTTVARGSLIHERGPSADVTLQWATYFDAADQAGQSRLWGGIHIQPDDFVGRQVGHRVAQSALARARSFFDGSAVP